VEIDWKQLPLVAIVQRLIGEDLKQLAEPNKTRRVAVVSPLISRHVTEHLAVCP